MMDMNIVMFVGWLIFHPHLSSTKSSNFIVSNQHIGVSPFLSPPGGRCEHPPNLRLNLLAETRGSCKRLVLIMELINCFWLGCACAVSCSARQSALHLSCRSVVYTHYNDTMSELTEPCPDHDVLIEKKCLN